MVIVMEENKKKIHKYFCYLYFSDYLPSKGIVVLNHNVTSHATENGVKNYYIGNILIDNAEITVVIDLTDLQKASSMQNMLEILNKNTESCIFKSKELTTEMVNTFFKGEIL
ncbi:hypothetical protein [Staphylococcus phage vB_SauM-V1SA22]|nr:hypothetical protein [Staphylococcus phage vB_SauM-V1SA19]UVD42681.1 hypothetical protein [Staphylococcus phage vB_SauM-V1SA22]